MPQLREVKDLDTLLRGAGTGPQDYPLIDHSSLGRVMVKRTPHTISEVLGYRLGEAIGVPLPRAEGFVIPNEVPLPETQSEASRIGMFVEYLPISQAWSLEAMCDHSPAIAASAMTLSIFDRHEWGSFGRSGERVFFYDLEKILPRFLVEIHCEEDAINLTANLVRATDEFRRGNDPAIGEIEKLASRYGLMELVGRHLRRLGRVRIDHWQQLFLLSPHPSAEVISRLAANALSARIERACALFGVSRKRTTHFRGYAKYPT